MLYEKVNCLSSNVSEWEHKFNALLDYSIDFEEKSRGLYQANQLLNENIFKLLDS